MLPHSAPVFTYEDVLFCDPLSGVFREEAVRGGEDPPAADDAASAHRARPLAVQAALPVAHLHAKQKERHNDGNAQPG